MGMMGKLKATQQRIEETKKRLDVVEDDVKELKKAHEVCGHYPLNQNRRMNQ